MKPEDTCTFCSQATLKVVPVDEPWNIEHLICTACDSTYFLDKCCYHSFDEWVAAYPDGEHFRNWIVDSRNSKWHIGWLFIPQDEPHSCPLPGGYVWALGVKRAPQLLELDPGSADYYVVVQDNDDGIMRKDFDTEEEVLEEMKNLEEMAPFHLWDLKEFGYDW